MIKATEKNDARVPVAPSFPEALKFWTRLGFISFGGPAGQIAIMHEFLVEKKKWISESRFLHALNYCMLLPGPEAQQLASYTGWLLHGTRGGIAAGLLFILPSMLILLGLSILYVSFGNNPYVYALFDGLKPAIVAIVILALIKIGKKSIKGNIHFIFATASFICIFFLDIAFPLIILGTALIALALIPLIRKNDQLYSKKDPAITEEEKGYFINASTVIEGTGFHPVKLIKTSLVCLLLWLIPLLILQAAFGETGFWKQLVFFFSQAALVTFGGAYAVLPYVAQVSVEKFEWLSPLQMIDGLALGETTPGPLIMVLAFVGFMAAGKEYGGSLLMGSLGLVTTTFYTFLPSFFFILAGAPLIEGTRENRKIREIMEYISCAVTGVVLNLCLYFGKAVLLYEDTRNPNWFALTWAVISYFALQRFKISMPLWILISALAGLIFFLAGQYI